MKRILMFDKEGTLKRIWDGIHYLPSKDIKEVRKCLKNKKLLHNDFFWIWENENEKDIAGQINCKKLILRNIQEKAIG